VKDSNLVKISIIISLVLSVVMIANTALSTYVLYTSSFTASVAPENGEQLDIAIATDTGRPTLLERIFNVAKDWLGSYYVGGSGASLATTGITISVTGSNVAAQASVTYYIEAVASDASGNAYRFLEGNGTAITVGGANLDPTNQTTIENHLTAMGLSTDASHEIDYYLYVLVEATGAISGDTLTSEITKTLFDTVNYQWGSEITGNIEPVLTSTVKEETPTTATPNEAWPRVKTRSGNDHYWLFHFDLSDVAAISVSGFYLRCDVMTYTSNSDWMLHSIESFDSSTTWNTQPDAISQLYCVSEQMDMGWHDWRKPAILSYLQSVEGGDAYVRVSKGDDVNERAFYGWGSSVPYLYLTYVGFSASWYNIPPLSIVDLPMSLDVAAVLAVIISAAIVLKTRRNKQK